MAVKKASKATKRKTSTNGKTAAASKSASKKAPAAKAPTVKDPMSKSGIISAITDMTTLAKRDVVAVLDSFSQLIEAHIKSRGPGKFVMPGMLKISVVKKPARAARKGINPFTGEEIMIKARPAYKVVKVKPLKKLKEMVD